MLVESLSRLGMTGGWGTFSCAALDAHPIQSWDFHAAMASKTQPTIMQLPPIGTIAPSIFTPERTSVYKQPLKIATPKIKNLADHPSQRLLPLLARSPTASNAKA